MHGALPQPTLRCSALIFLWCPPAPSLLRQLLCIPRHFETREQFDITFKTSHAGQLGAAGPVGLCELPPLRRQLLARSLLVGGAALQDGVVPIGSGAALAADIELREVARDGGSRLDVMRDGIG